MKKNFSLLLIAVLAIIVVAPLLGNNILANPGECPPGQRDNCKWVQHGVTGKCQWLPDHALAWPWKIVPEGTCPPLKGDPTQAPPADTEVPPPADTPVPPADTQVPPVVNTPNTSSGNPAVTPTPTCTPMAGEAEDICDLCLEVRRIADAQETQTIFQATMAAAQATMAAKP